MEMGSLVTSPPGDLRTPEVKPKPAGWVVFMRDFVDFLFAPWETRDPCGTPFTTRQCINIHKLLVPVVYMAILFHFGGHDGVTFANAKYYPAAISLFVAHTVYGICWVYKDVHFGDASWKRPMTVLGFIIIFTYPLFVYYMPMLCLVSDMCFWSFAEGNEFWVVGLGLVFYLVGFFYHFCSDAQKYFVLKYQRPRSLITNGLFAHCRNPNYFGEIMIYTGYAIWSCHYITLPIFASAWLIIFLPNMLAKEASMSRYPQWNDWCRRTGLFIPWLPSLVWDLLVMGLNRHGLPEPAEQEQASVSS